MCGIAGMVSWQQPVSRAVVAAMTERVAHRGPDAGSVRTLGPATFGHRRLAVIDLNERSNQPMADETGRFLLTYNGEIYNFAQLRNELEAFGHRFHTGSDTEVIIEAYRRWGCACVERFFGMFAFALWDELEQSLFLARDRLGKKPLVLIRLAGGGIAFASEVHSLHAVPEFEARFDVGALHHYLTFNFVGGHHCIFAKVEKLQPGHTLLIRRDRTSETRRYWDLAASLRAEKRTRPDQEAAEELSALIDEAVRSRLMADVPLGVLLSGGIDSAAIAAATRASAQGSGLRGYTMAFSNPRFCELADTRRTGDSLGMEVVSENCDLTSNDRLARIVAHMDEPFADSSMFPTYLVAEFARRHTTVCLSGDGGDELFAGYETYLADRLHRRLGWVPRSLWRYGRSLADHLLPASHDRIGWDLKIRLLLGGLGRPWPDAHPAWREILPPAQALRLLRPGLTEEVADTDPYATTREHFREVKDCHWLDQAMYIDVKTWLANDILVKVDRASMAHGLEIRSPLLDHRIVEYAAGLPADQRLRGRHKKFILRHSQAARLPAEVLNRRKRGFNAPVASWLLAKDCALREALLSPEADDLFDQDIVISLLLAHQNRQMDNHLPLLGIANFRLWQSAHSAVVRRAA